MVCFNPPFSKYEILKRIYTPMVDENKLIAPGLIFRFLDYVFKKAIRSGALLRCGEGSRALLLHTGAHFVSPYVGENEEKKVLEILVSKIM